MASLLESQAAVTVPVSSMLDTSRVGCNAAQRALSSCPQIAHTRVSTRTDAGRGHARTCSEAVDRHEDDLQGKFTSPALQQLACWYCTARLLQRKAAIVQTLRAASHDVHSILLGCRESERCNHAAGCLGGVRHAEGVRLRGGRDAQRCVT